MGKSSPKSPPNPETQRDEIEGEGWSTSRDVIKMQEDNFEVDLEMNKGAPGKCLSKGYYVLLLHLSGR